MGDLGLLRMWGDFLGALVSASNGVISEVGRAENVGSLKADIALSNDRVEASTASTDNRDLKNHMELYMFSIQSASMGR